MNAPTEVAVRLMQTNPRLGDVQANLQVHLDAVRQAIADGISLIVFPELSLTGYYLRDLVPDVALHAQAPELAELALLSKQIGIIAGFVEEDENFSFYTAQAYFEGGELRHIHRKVYLPTYGMFDEGRYFTAGQRIRIADTRFGRMGLLICEDLWHPSAPYILSREGMHFLVACASSPGRGVQGAQLATETTYANMLSAYASLFQVYVLFCNRVGCEDGVSFWGGSRIVAPNGETVASAPVLDPGFVDAQLHPSEIRRARMMAPLVDDENLDLTLRELGRISRE